MVAFSIAWQFRVDPFQLFFSPLSIFSNTHLPSFRPAAILFQHNEFDELDVFQAREAFSAIKYFTGGALVEQYTCKLWFITDKWPY